MGFKLLSDNECIDFQKKCQKSYRAGENQGDQLVGSCASITLKLLLGCFKGSFTSYSANKFSL